MPPVAIPLEAKSSAGPIPRRATTFAERQFGALDGLQSPAIGPSDRCLTSRCPKDIKYWLTGKISMRLSRKSVHASLRLPTAVAYAAVARRSNPYPANYPARGPGNRIPSADACGRNHNVARWRLHGIGKCECPRFAACFTSRASEQARIFRITLPPSAFTSTSSMQSSPALPRNKASLAGHGIRVDGE